MDIPSIIALNSVIQEWKRSGGNLAIEEWNRLNKKLEPYLRIVEDTTRVLRDIEKFRRENEVVANLYRDEVSEYLATRGWYVGVSLRFRNIKQLAEAINQGNRDAEIESAIANHVRSQLDSIEDAAIQHWPDRSGVLSDAFSAHRNGQFTLSIPAILAQADGVALGILKAHLFTNHPNKIDKLAKDFIESDLAHNTLASSFVGILFEKPGLRTRTDIRDEKRQAGQPFSPLNRHGVLHGIDLDYATESNSLRAASLIGFLSQVAEWKSPPADSES